MPVPTSVRVVVRLPWDRPDTNALPDPPPIEWNSEKADILWKYIERSRSSDSAGPDWKGLAAHLDVPLPYLLYRVNARFQEDIRGLKDIQGALSPSGSQPPTKPFEAGIFSEKSPTAARVINGIPNSPRFYSSGHLSTTPLGVRARLNSLGKNSPKPRKAMSSSTLTLQAQIRTHTPSLRPTTPSSSEGTDSEEEAARKEEDADRDAEEQEALDRKLQQLQEMMTNDVLGLVSSSRPRNKGKGPDRGRSGQGSMVGSYRQDGLSSSSVSHSVSSVSSPQGSIPDIPSPPSESQPRSTIQRRLSASKSSSPPALSPRSALGQRYRPLMDRTASEHSSSHGSEASSFSDLSDADLSTSALESALMSNIRGGGSRLSQFARSRMSGRALMELTFVTNLGQPFVVEIDPNMELENVMALLEAESGIPIAEQSISFENKELNDPKRTMQELGLSGDKVMLLLRRKVTNPVGGQAVQQDAEMMRLQILGDPSLMNQLREAQPEIADAAQNNPQRFAELLRHTQERQYQAELDQQREIARLNADPYDLEAQHKIEEAIRQQGVLENLQHALEYSPENFGRVTMLVPVEVNGHPVKAFVDSGAQQTINQRWAGVARGVGTAKILGRVHSVQLKLSDLHLPCAITIMEGQDVDLLFGLDMLKAHQACIDLSKNALRIQGREVQFLSEHELPEKARREATGEMPPPEATAGPSSSVSTPAPAQSFPGGGHALGAPPASQHVQSPAPTNQPAQSHHSEERIRTLMDLGATRDVAIRSLDAAGGNIDVAASFLF
ncbi:hypothetical protein C0991_006550 [Blastosporella zonata]|nr:hypothetical protein C0991_006550 [Blastosporella zonata]